MIRIMPFLLCFCMFGAQNVRRIQLSEEVLDQLQIIEKIYDELLKTGMTPEKAAIAASKWQDQNYPVILSQMIDQDRKEKDAEKKKKEKS
jgi:hypothetical protein